MNNQLYINEILIPLLPDSVIALSYQVNNIASTKDIRGNNSNTFTVKANAITCYAFGFANLPTSSTKIPYRQLPARYIEKGIDLLKGGGYAVVQEYRDYEKEFDVELYSGNLDFFATIDGKSIKDLDLSAYNHLWNAATIQASFSNTAGYIYPLIDYGILLESGNELRTDRLYPAIFQHTIINQIFFESGFEVEGPILSDLRHQALILPFVNGKPGITDNFGVNRSFRAGPKVPTIIFYPGNGEGDKDIIFDDDYTGSRNFFQGIHGNYNPSTGEYTVDEACLANTQASVDYSGEITIGNATMALKLLINGVTVLNSQREESFDPTGPPDRKGNLTIQADNLILQAGDVLKLVTNIDAGGLTTYQFNFFLSREANPEFQAAFWSLTVQDELPVGGLWKVSENLPDISQIDLLKNWAQVFGLIFNTDSNSRTVGVRQFEEVGNNAPLAKDFSGKLITSRTARQTWRLDYAQNNWFRYKEEDGVSVLNSDGSLVIDDRNLPLNKDMFTMEFSGTPMVSRLNHLQFALIPLFEKFKATGSANPRLLVLARQNVESGLHLVSNVVNITKFEYPIDSTQTKITTERPHGFHAGELISVRGAPNPNLNVTDLPIILDSAYNFRLEIPGSGAFTPDSDALGSIYCFSSVVNVTAQLPIPYFILPGNSFNLGFGDNLLDKNYNRLMAMLNPLQVQEAYFKLNEVDIAQLDQFIPVWVEAWGAYYFLQQVKDYQSNALTRLILLRL